MSYASRVKLNTMAKVLGIDVESYWTHEETIIRVLEAQQERIQKLDALIHEHLEDRKELIE